KQSSERKAPENAATEEEPKLPAMAAKPRSAELERALAWIAQIAREDQIDEATAERAGFAPEMRNLPGPALVEPPEMAAAEAATLFALAEKLAIDHAVQRYQRGELAVNGAQQLLGKLTREIEDMRGLLAEQNEELARAGMNSAAHAERMQREFWANVPES